MGLMLCEVWSKKSIPTYMEIHTKPQHTDYAYAKQSVMGGVHTSNDATGRHN